MIEKIIKNVLELPGVDGACILDKKGVLLHNALPDFFLDDFLDDLARRVTALYEAVDENYMQCNDYLLKYPQKFIQLRRSRNVYLLVAVDPTVNLVSLRMVTNLVLKHITPKVLSELRASLKAQAVADPVIEEVAAPIEIAEVSKPVESPQVAESVEPAQVEEESQPEPTRGRRALRPRPARSFRGTRY
jgi:predicted regulator of Ras-like GTPase activity (Roadblock/LC7/MglB family)